MSDSEYRALFESPPPRPDARVRAYVDRGVRSHKKMVWIFVAMGVAMWVVASIADASGGHSGSVLGSFGKGLLIMGPLSMLIIGPVLLYWSVNRSSLTKLVAGGHALAARERSREVMQIRGTRLVKFQVEFNEGYGRVSRARFELAIDDAPEPGTQFQVLRRSGTTVAVVWPDNGLALARLISA